MSFSINGSAVASWGDLVANAVSGDTIAVNSETISDYAMGPDQLAGQLNCTITGTTFVGGSNTEAGGALRMVLIQRGSLHYMAICSRYHTNLVQLRDLVLSVAPDCVNAYVLDGGGSSQMVFIDTLVNKLTSKPRPIPDIIYFASAWFDQ